MSKGNASTSKNLKRNYKFPSLWEVAIILLTLYSFFFQYAVKQINNAMFTLCLANIIFGFFFLIKKGRLFKSYFLYILLFILMSFIMSLLIGVSPKYSTDIGLKMIEYSLTCYSIYLFVLANTNKTYHIIFFIWISIFLLSVNVMIRGEVVDYLGAIGITSLNSNEMSSFYIFMVYCAFLLYGHSNNKLFKIIFLGSIIFVFILQILAASRRGFIVMSLMILSILIFGFIPMNNKKHSRKRMIISSLVMIFIALSFFLLRNYILSETILGERLSGIMTGGDAARNNYQIFAYEQFVKHPIFGVGLGGVAYLQGVYSHSLFYETLACTGIFGTVLLFMALFYAGWQLVKLLKNPKLPFYQESYFSTKVTLIYFIALLLSGFAVVMIYNFYFYYSLIIIAIVIYLNTNKLNKSNI